MLARDADDFITRRKYDFFGNILEEGLPNGLSISNEYDLLNNKIKTTFQDGSSVEYKYNPIYLKEIIRKDKNGFELYKHEYLKYDLAGNLLKENLILDSGDVEYFIDKLSRVTKIKTKFHDQRSEEHTSELQSHSFISYAVFCLKKKIPLQHISYTSYYN